MFPIKYIDNNLVWNEDNEVFAYYELIPYNYSFLSAEQKFIVHDSFRQLIAQSREGKIHALQIATESSIRSMQEQSKKLVTGKLKEVAYQKIDDRSEKIKTSIALLISFLIMTGLLCIMQLDIVIMKLREGKVIVSAAVIIGIYVAVFFVYLHFTKMRASRQYDEVRARVLIYDKHLEELETLYKEKENEDISPTIVEEEDEDGKIIDI